MAGLLQDLRFGFRSLRKNPAFALVAILTLAVGFGVNLAMLGLTRAVLFHPLPYVEADRLVVLWRQTEHFERSSISFPTYFDWRERNRVFSRFDLLLGDHRNLTGGGGDPERLDALLVSAGLLGTLGLEAHIGRGFSPSDDRVGAERTAMVSYELWQRRFGGDSGVVGRLIELDGIDYAVIGVLPPGLASERLGRTLLGDVWLPVGVFFDELPVHERATRSGIVPVARLAPGVGLEAARADMDRIAQELEAEHPLEQRGNRARLAPVREDLVGDLRPAMLILLATVGALLLIACANLVSLLLARSVSREQELAIRVSLGAGRARLVCQGLAEGLALAICGSLVGLGLAALALRLVGIVLPGVPYASDARLSTFVVGSAIALCFAVTLLIGLVPALRTAAPSWRQLTGTRGGGMLPVHQRLRRALVTAEIGLALVLLIGAVLAVESFRNLRRQNLGFEPQRTLSFLVSLPMSKYGEAPAWTAFFDDVLESVGRLPGVESAAVSSWLPMGDGGGGSRVLAADRPIPAVPDMSVTNYLAVSADYFQALAIPLLEGRGFDSGDDDRLGAERVVVVSETLARHFWPDRSAVGQRIAFELDGTPREFEPLWREVVGVVGDVRYESPRTAASHTVYVPYTQRPLWFEGYSPLMAVLLDTAIEPEALVPSLRSSVRQIDFEQPIHGVRALKDVVADHLHQPRMVSALLTSFAGLALALSLVGIYGLVSYMVAVRVREIGIRMALGARPLQVLGRLLFRNAGLIVAGIVLGLGLAAGLTRLMSSELYGVEALDPATFAAAAALLSAVAFLATLVPATRTVRLDPSRTLRHE